MNYMDEYARYWADVRGYANDALEAVREDPDRDIGDILHETCDGSQWVIYYHRAAMVCVFTNRDEAGFEILGKELLNECESAGQTYCRIAYWALRADIQNAISATLRNRELIAATATEATAEAVESAEEEQCPDSK